VSGTVLEVRDLHLRRGQRSILSGVGFSVERGALLALMGPSGSGKTTMLRAIAALERFDEGSIAIDGLVLQGGRPLSSEDLRQLRTRVGLVFQFHHLFEHLPALKNITLAPIHVHHVAQAAAEARARDLLRALGVDHRADALPRELSGGEAQRVAIARALAVDPPVLMMDEPTASLDPPRRTELGELLRQLAAQNRAILVSTHDEDFARDFATGILRLDNGVVRNDHTDAGNDHTDHTDHTDQTDPAPPIR
jgi:polar amino acid transport system ATP-binding protein